MTPLIDDPQHFGKPSMSAASDEANWFFIIAVLSVVNEILPRLGIGVFFVGEMGSTWFAQQFAQAHAARFGAATTAVGYSLAGLAIALYAMFGLFARKGHVWAWIAGIAFYVADGLLIYHYGAWLQAAFHLLIIYFLIAGFVTTLRGRSAHPEPETEAAPLIAPQVQAPPGGGDSGHSLYPRL